MTLLEQQQLFCSLIAKLITWAYEHGYQLTFGESYRTPEQAALNADAGRGIRNSQHTRRLAVDLNLFRGRQWLRDSESHRPLGEYWKSLHPTARWGGDFKRPDGNHYSLERDGVK